MVLAPRSYLTITVSWIAHLPHRNSLVTVHYCSTVVYIPLHLVWMMRWKGTEFWLKTTQLPASQYTWYNYEKQYKQNFTMNYRDYFQSVEQVNLWTLGDENLYFLHSYRPTNTSVFLYFDWNGMFYYVLQLNVNLYDMGSSLTIKTKMRTNNYLFTSWETKS